MGLPYVSKVESPFSDYIAFLTGVTHNATLATQYVEKHGLKNAPPFIKDGVYQQGQFHLSHIYCV
ncbi:hypothetical protein KN1_13890 [Stygiolobus caldivivus]|uniref:Uncharacterized protein n=1 Tax=Stygiolobus caldivivus TaxID=2824673 RepID=A0A8D5U6E2_9CREN|nr:hypothetical protein KN1_13890 [Stygiolobus caldivivus]